MIVADLHDRVSSLVKMITQQWMTQSATNGHCVWCILIDPLWHLGNFSPPYKIIKACPTFCTASFMDGWHNRQKPCYSDVVA